MLWTRNGWILLPRAGNVVNEDVSRNYKDDIYFTATLLEFAARMTNHRISDIAKLVGTEGIEVIYRFANVSHCLSFEENCDELIEKYGIQDGAFNVMDTKPEGITAPRFLSIGRSYADLVAELEQDPKKYPETLHTLLTSELSSRMENYHSALFYSPMDYQLMVYHSIAERPTSWDAVNN